MRPRASRAATEGHRAGLLRGHVPQRDRRGPQRTSRNREELDPQRAVAAEGRIAGGIMNDCAQFKEQYESYPLGLLEAEERAALQAHLPSAGPVTVPAVAH